jgi:hypothetical protein
MSPASSSASLFETAALPVFAFLSEESRQALSEFVSAGNAQRRSQQLLEFFKTLDWLPLDEIESVVIQKLSLPVRRRLFAEIRAYLASKDDARREDAAKREDYKRRIIDHYRKRLSSSDKALLEALRDFELNLTGRDVNWQHYFGLKSFKRIDEFADATPAARQDWILKFKQDVLTYKKNLDMLQHAAACQAGEAHVYNFDDWLEDNAERSASEFYNQGGPQGRQQRQRSAPAPEPEKLTRLAALKQMGLSASSGWEEVRSRFRQLTLQHHPDMPGGNADLMKSILQAYEALKPYYQLK